jgi:iron-sulfur cluster assembly protein
VGIDSRIALDLPTTIHVVVTLTEVAATKVGALLSDEEHAQAGLRVAVRGGGCSGFQYQLALDEQRDGDKVFDHDGIRIIVDEMSLQYVDGSTVDYTESLMGAGFQVNNPNVVAACGCGSSFRVADEEPSCGAEI